MYNIIKYSFVSIIQTDSNRKAPKGVFLMMKRLKRLRKNKKGMTLVEIVVAIAVVSIVFAATMSAIVHSYSTILSNKSVDDASLEAEGIADSIVSTIAGAEESKINDLVNGSTVSGAAYDGLALITGAEYVDRITFPAANFPDSSLANTEKQFTIERVMNLETSKSGSAAKTFNGYKVSVAVLSSEGYITVTALTASN